MTFVWMLAILLTTVLLAQSWGYAVDYLWLGAQWVELPKFPGDVGVLRLSFYLSSQYVDVTISLTPRCLELTPLDEARLPAAGPGVFSANIKVRASALDVMCPAVVTLDARYRLSGGSLVDGISKWEAVEIYIPPYPTAEVYVRGVAHLGLPTNVTLAIRSPYGLAGVLAVEGQGARVLQPRGPVALNGSHVEIPVALIADTPTPALRVTIQSRDWLGSPVTLSFLTPVATAPAPSPLVVVTPGVLYGNRYNRVNLSVLLPLAVDGEAVVTTSGGAMSQSSVSIPIRGGRGAATVEVYPTSPVVTFNVQLSYSVAGVVKTDAAAVSAAVQQGLGGVAQVEVRPSRLIAGVVNNVTLAVAAPGVFNASISVSNAAVDKATPYFFSGRDRAAVQMLITPLSTQPVVFTVSIYHGGGVEQYVATLPVSSSSIFTITATPSVIHTGGNRTIAANIVNSGDFVVQKAVVTISPGVHTVVAPTYSYQVERLAPLQQVSLPISFIAPATLSGAVPFVYSIVYTTELGTVGTAQGTFYIQALQVPAVEVTNVAVVPQTPELYKTFFISVTVVNKGYSPVASLQVEAQTPPGVKAVTPTYFAGQLDAQQSASIPMSFNATSPGAHQLRLVVTYTDPYGNRHAVVRNVTIVVTNGTTAPADMQRQPQAQYAIAAGVVAAAGAAAAGGLWYVARKKQRR
ncbi:MAG: hypothetical protein ACK4SY_05565 [Pyrobaculum sp.]